MSRSPLLVLSIALLAFVGSCKSGGGRTAPAAVAVRDAEGPLGLASTTGVVVSQSQVGSEVGAAILRKGGNAIDAAIATGMAMVVTNRRTQISAAAASRGSPPERSGRDNRFPGKGAAQGERICMST
jgi:hypothetical protein